MAAMCSLERDVLEGMNELNPGINTKPRRRATAYAFFVQIVWEENRKKHPDRQIDMAFFKKCFEKWMRMTRMEREIFHGLADEDKVRYENEMKDYQKQLLSQRNQFLDSDQSAAKKRKMEEFTPSEEHQPLQTLTAAKPTKLTLLAPQGRPRNDPALLESKTRTGKVKKVRFIIAKPQLESGGRGSKKCKIEASAPPKKIAKPQLESGGRGSKKCKIEASTPPKKSLPSSTLETASKAKSRENTPIALEGRCCKNTVRFDSNNIIGRSPLPSSLRAPSIAKSRKRTLVAPQGRCSKNPAVPEPKIITGEMRKQRLANGNRLLKTDQLGAIERKMEERTPLKMSLSSSSSRTQSLPKSRKGTPTALQGRRRKNSAASESKTITGQLKNQQLVNGNLLLESDRMKSKKRKMAEPTLPKKSQSSSSLRTQSLAKLKKGTPTALQGGRSKNSGVTESTAITGRLRKRQLADGNHVSESDRRVKKRKKENPTTPKISLSPLSTRTQSIAKLNKMIPTAHQRKRPKNPAVSESKVTQKKTKKQRLANGNHPLKSDRMMSKKRNIEEPIMPKKSQSSSSLRTQSLPKSRKGTPTALQKKRPKNPAVPESKITTEKTRKQRSANGNLLLESDRMKSKKRKMAEPTVPKQSSSLRTQSLPKSRKGTPTALQGKRPKNSAVSKSTTITGQSKKQRLANGNHLLGSDRSKKRKMVDPTVPKKYQSSSTSRTLRQRTTIAPQRRSH